MQMIAKLFALAPAALALSLAVSTGADAFQRSGTWTGPAGGVYTSQGSRSCANGSCSSTGSVTGPAGNTVSRTGSSSCAGGVCTGQATYTGPAGRTTTHTYRVTR